MNQPYSLIIITLSILFMVSCGVNNNDDPPGEPFITGIITDINRNSNTILVEENPDINGPLESGGNKIWLSVNEKTEVLKDENGLLIECDFDCFEINSRVSVWVTGSVAESYPLQGTASRIVIFGLSSLLK